MATDSRTLTFERKIQATPVELYRAFTNATALREWLADVATTSPKKGGRFYIAWNDGYYTSGEFAALTPGEQVTFTWRGRDDPASTTVHVSMAPENGGTQLRLEHDGLGTGELWAETFEALEKAWPISLENLASVMETGEDLRFTRRPMLGITIDDFNADVAAELGVPVDEGVRLDGVVAGMGAEAAGLQANDVLVSMAGRPVVDWATLSAALAVHQAGDTIDVDFYRGAEKHAIEMTLSGRPIPQIPKTARALAEAARKRYAEVESELEAFFEGVSDAEAGHKPAPDAWSAKETLAHLIHSERDWHNWMADMIAGHEPWSDEWGGNLQARVTATVVAYPTVEALLNELKRHHAETVALVSNLPPEFIDRKGTYWRLAYNLQEEPYHHRTHLQQMQEAVEAARQQ